MERLCENLNKRVAAGNDESEVGGKSQKVAGSETMDNILLHLNTENACINGGSSTEKVQPVHMQLAQLHFHPRDCRITFIPEDHVYLLDGNSQFCLSVTGVVSQFFSEFEPEKIINKYYHLWAGSYESKYFISS